MKSMTIAKVTIQDSNILASKGSSSVNIQDSSVVISAGGTSCSLTSGALTKLNTLLGGWFKWAKEDLLELAFLFA